MIKNGKYYVAPPLDGGNFKTLLKRMVAIGAGQLVDRSGMPPGPWTADTLADAISELDGNRAGIDRRTVQLWLQDNDRGISTKSVHYLAMVFGCDDSEATSGWQAEIMASLDRLGAQKRASQNQSDQLEVGERKLETESANARSLGGYSRSNAKTSESHLGIAGRSEAAFSQSNAFALTTVVWAGFAALAFLTYILGVDNVHYSPTDGLSKQVGFLFAPSWTLLPVVILPMLIFSVHELLEFWKNKGRTSLVQAAGRQRGQYLEWNDRIKSQSCSFWAIFFVSFVIIFGLQWSGVYLRALLNGDATNFMMDWNIVTLVRPDVISVPAAIFLSFVAYLYFSFLMWIFFVGLLLFYTVVRDFSDVCSDRAIEASANGDLQVDKIGIRVMISVFRCTVLAILFCTCIRLQSTYLVSDGTNVISWLIKDGLSLFGGEANSWLEQKAIARFTSIVLLYLTCFVFFGCCILMSRVICMQPNTGRAIFRWLPKIAIVIILAINLYLIGRVNGFSFFLVASVVAAAYALYNPSFQLRDSRH